MATSNKTKTQSLENIKALSSLYSSEFAGFNNSVVLTRQSLEGIIKKLNEKEAAILAKKKQAEKLIEESDTLNNAKAVSIEPEVNISKEPEVKEAKEHVKTVSEPKAEETKKQFVERPERRPYQQQPRPNSFVPGQYTNRPNNNNQRPGLGQTQNARPNNNNARPSPVNLAKVVAPPATSAVPKNKVFIEKKKFDNRSSDGQNSNKKTLMKKGIINSFAPNAEDKMGSRKYKAKKSKEQIIQERIKIEKAVVNSEIVPIKTLSEKLGITATEIAKRLFKNDIIKTINESVDFETAALIALDLGIELEMKLDRTAEEILSEFQVSEDVKDVKLVKRPPVVTVLGHVDHGKTSLLDAIRKTSVVAGEAGGITQHIGAYTVKINNQPITFIDTPGHEAFTAMRARGAQVTDVAVLVVAADDGVMPQTIEAINHAKAANVSIVVAINKIDKPNADTEKIKQQLSEYSILPEEWGGDSIMVPVSAKGGIGIEKLLEAIILVADVKELKANPKRKARGTVIEAKLDKGKGPIATVLIQDGTLKVGDTVIAGTSIGKIRAMLDDKGAAVKDAGPSYAVAILGFSEVPNAGDMIFAVDEKLSRQVLNERLSTIKESMVKSSTKLTLDDAFSKINEGQLKSLNLIVKADVQGSVEAVRESLAKLSNEEVKVHIVHGGVGAINDSDIMLAKAASAIIIGFNVKCDSKSKQLAEQSNVEIRQYSIIYEAIDDLTLALKGMLAPKYKEVILGKAEVRNVFKVTGSGTIAGSYILDGKVTRNAHVRIKRGGEQIFDGKISSLKRFKDDVKEVGVGYECGISIDNFSDFKELDILEVYNLEIINQ